MRHIAYRIWQAGSRISDGFGLWQHEVMFGDFAPLVAEAWYGGLDATGHDPVDMVWYGNMRDARHIADQLQDCVTRLPRSDQRQTAAGRLPLLCEALFAELESIVMAGSEVHGPDLYPIWDYLPSWTPEDKDKMEKIWVFIEDNETNYGATSDLQNFTCWR